MKYLNKTLGLAFMLGLVASCNTPAEKEKNAEAVSPSSKEWLGTIKLNDSTDLNFEFITRLDQGDFWVINGVDTVKAKLFEEDSLYKVEFPVFANYLLVVWAEDELSGRYINPDGEDYVLPFKATPLKDKRRYPADAGEEQGLQGKWEMRFNPNTEKAREAMAFFEVEGKEWRGSVMTTTGDYRFLSGGLSGQTLRLSTFDGGFLYYFEWDVSADTLVGKYYAGRSGFAPLAAWRNEQFALANPDSLTFLKPGYESFDFAFPNLEGDTVRLSDPQFAGKPLVVQIMGSWCPNCLDEVQYMKEVQQKYPELAMVGLTFERGKTAEEGIRRAKKMVRDLEIPYPILLAGATREDQANDKLPALNRLMSYPTAIYLNRQHKVVKIHTGFAGPGTPVYPNFVAENDQFVQSLVQE